LIVKYLLDLEATTTLINSEGKTALELAKEALLKATPTIKPGKRAEKAVKGTLLDKLEVTVNTLVKSAQPD
jgi:hypothetical protein